jgi:hypothetical protein
MLKDVINNLNFSSAKQYFPLWENFAIPQHFLEVSESLSQLMRPFLEGILEYPDPLINILSIGGRDCLELSILINLFANHPTKKLNFVMIDIDSSVIVGCQILYQKFMGENINFIHGDATYLNFQPSAKYHGIVMRHPQFWNRDGTNIFSSVNIVKNTLSYYLYPLGKIFVSFYHKEEKDYFASLASNLFLPRHFHITQHQKGSYIFPAPHPRMSDLIFDQYTAVL